MTLHRLLHCGEMNCFIQCVLRQSCSPYLPFYSAAHVHFVARSCFSRFEQTGGWRIILIAIAVTLQACGRKSQACGRKSAIANSPVATKLRPASKPAGMNLLVARKRRAKTITNANAMIVAIASPTVGFCKLTYQAIANAMPLPNPEMSD